MQNTKVLLLGHTGFIGRTVFNQLKSENISVHGISSKDINLLYTKSPEKLGKFLKKNTILIIATAVTRELGDNLQTLENNIKIITNAAKAIEKFKIRKCIYLSTVDVYGIPKKLPITEETTINPKSYYGVAKFTCESLLQVASKSSGFPFLILRYNGVFGPGQKNIGYGPNYFIKEACDKGVVKIWGDGKELRDVLYVKDLAKIIVQLSLSDAVGVYNIASGKSHSFIDILKMLKNISPKKLKIEKRRRTSPSFNQIFNTKKLRRTLTELTFTPIKRSLEETYRAI